MEMVGMWEMEKSKKPHECKCKKKEGNARNLRNEINSTNENIGWSGYASWGCGILLGVGVVGGQLSGAAGQEWIC
jgi:hypothetical protein